MKRWLPWFASCLFLAVLGGCATSASRVFLDSTTHSDSPPSWAEGTQMVWEDGDTIHLKASHTVRGDERVNGCFDLARLDAKEQLITEIATDVRGSLDSAQQSISENAELVLGKVRSGAYDGRITGLRFAEEYYERYRVGATERVDCHVLGAIGRADYAQVKRNVVERIVAADPRLKEAVTQKQIDFFRPDERAPASPKE